VCVPDWKGAAPRRAGLALAASVALLAAAGPAAAQVPGLAARTLDGPGLVETIAVFGRDDRVALPAAQSRLGAGIGILTNPRARSVCTAFCVSDSIVATAAHCLFRTAEEPAPRLEDFTFARVKNDPRQRTRLAGHAQRMSLGHVVAGSTSLSIKPPIDATRDWALARLATPVCRGHALPLAPADDKALVEAAAANRLLVAGYHRDFPRWQIAASRQCEVKHLARGPDEIGFRRDFVDAERLILHTCDTGGASSGSPLLIETPRGPVVVGINVGTYVQSKVMMQNGEVVHRFKADEIANTAVAISAPAAALSALETADVLAGVGPIRALQKELASRGHYAGAIDGTHGLKLKSAIEAYERTEKLTPTGLPTRALLERLGVTVVVEAPPRSGRRSAATQRRLRQTGLQ
jgi:protease YdgD